MFAAVGAEGEGGDVLVMVLRGFYRQPVSGLGPLRILKPRKLSLALGPAAVTWKHRCNLGVAGKFVILDTGKISLNGKVIVSEGFD